MWESQIPELCDPEEDKDCIEDESGVEGEDGVKDEGTDLNIRLCGTSMSHCYIRPRDPLDEQDFDEAASFPSFKPDRDLFGPPRRCRKQRGWYYVKRWPPAAHTIDNVPQEAEYATGADIPQELFNDIVASYLTIPRIRGVGTLRLVCRHWERLCTNKHFYEITLTTLEDVNTGLAALSNRRAWGWPAYPVWYLHLRLNVAENSCVGIHTVHTKLVPELAFSPEVTLQIHGPIPAGQRLTSVYQTSPRRSLWYPLWIRRLTLIDLHFVKLDNLIRILRELPILRTVKGSRITWDAEPEVYPRATSFIPADLAPRVGPSPFSPSLTEYDFDDCQHGLAAAIACFLSPSGTPPITQPDADLLCALITGSNSAEDMPRTADKQCSSRTDGGICESASLTRPSLLLPLC